MWFNGRSKYTLSMVHGQWAHETFKDWSIIYFLFIGALVQFIGGGWDIYKILSLLNILTYRVPRIVFRFLMSLLIKD